jgi:predicted metal-dependent HD superfamily phosphohydrolase
MTTPASTHLSNSNEESLAALMRRRWMRLLRQFQVDEDAAQAVFEELVTLYTGPDRFYHDLSHIRELLDIIAGFEPYIDDYTAVRLAVWFHDAIYNTRANDNEVLSAALARRALTHLGLPQEAVLRVQELILATAGHYAVPHDLDAQILLDADLSPLGASPDVFASDGQDLQREHAWMSDSDYAAARQRILKDFLDRERLFQTAWFRDKYEDQARRNISRSLETVGKDGRGN